jgi:PKD domain-containing protein
MSTPITPLDINITDEFFGPTYSNYTVYNSQLLTQFANQNHVDIRTFISNGDSLYPEGWTVNGVAIATGSTSLGPQSTSSYWPGIVVTLTGTTTLVSSVPTNVVNILQGFADTDYVSLGFPVGVPSTINTATSYIQFTDGNGNVSPKIFLNQSIVALSSGTCEFRVQRGLFNIAPVNLGDIVTVTIVAVASSGNPSFQAQGLRLLQANWQQGPVDFDTWAGRLRSTVNPCTNGSDTISTGYTVGGNPYTQPILLRSDNPSSANDPTPINAQIELLVYTGANISATNTFTTYMREDSSGTYNSQLTLNSLTQAQLNGLPQPNENTSVPSHNFIYFQFQWGAVASMTIGNNLTTSPYTFTGLNGGGLFPTNSWYLVLLTLNGTAAQAQIWPLSNGIPTQTTPIFDTTSINDRFMFTRRKGRVGWNAVMNDGSTWIDSFRQRSAMFAEYRSTALNSITPVSGGQVFANSTPNTELFVGFTLTPASSGSTLTRDGVITTTGSSYKITTYGAAAPQGIVSNMCEFKNAPQAGVTFDIWYPTKTPPSVSLLGNHGSTITLPIPQLVPNQWNTITIPAVFLYNFQQAGGYQLQILGAANATTSFWIDGVSVYERAVAWSARSVVNDAWNANYAPWTSFYDAINSNQSGATFPVWGTAFQVRAEAYRQDASILTGTPQFIPQYAQLGKLVWPEDNTVSGLAAITASISYSQISGHEYLFDATGSSGGASYPIYYQWGLGDGTLASGPKTIHTFSAAGSYPVSLSITDANNNIGTTSVTATIS